MCESAFTQLQAVSVKSKKLEPKKLKVKDKILLVTQGTMTVRNVEEGFKSRRTSALQQHPCEKPSTAVMRKPSDSHTR